MLVIKDIQNWVSQNVDLISLVALVSVVYLNLSDILIKHHGLPGINKVLVPVLLALALYYQIKRDGVATGFQLAIVVGAIYYGFQAGSALYADDYKETQEAASHLSKHMLVMIAIGGLVLRVSALKYMAWALLASCSFIAFLSVIAYYSQDSSLTFGGFHRWNVQINEYGKVASQRIGGQIGDPNFYSQMLLLVLPTGLVFAFNPTSRRERILGGVCTLMIILAIICTLSRGGWLIMMVMLMIFVASLILTYGISNRSAQLGLVMVIGALLCLPFVLPEQVINRMFSLVQTVDTARSDGVINDGAISGRVDAMRVAAHAFVEHPVLGLGYNNIKTHYQDLSRQKGLTARGEDRGTHSLYLQILSEGGLLGSLLFLTVVYLAISSAQLAIKSLLAAGEFSAAWYVRGFLFGYFAYLGAGILLHSGFARYFWLMTGILIATLNLVSVKQDTRSKITSEF